MQWRGRRWRAGKRGGSRRRGGGGEAGGCEGGGEAKEGFPARAHPANFAARALCARLRSRQRPRARRPLVQSRCEAVRSESALPSLKPPRSKPSRSKPSRSPWPPPQVTACRGRPRGASATGSRQIGQMSSEVAQSSSSEAAHGGAKQLQQLAFIFGRRRVCAACRTRRARKASTLLNVSLRPSAKGTSHSTLRNTTQSKMQLSKQLCIMLTLHPPLIFESRGSVAHSQRRESGDQQELDKATHFPTTSTPLSPACRPSSPSPHAPASWRRT